MKKIYLLFAALLVITCAKEEDPIVTPPAVVIPPPSFVIPPVTSPETSTPPSYDGGDISISSREDLDYYREINVQNITGNFELNLDWTYVDNSTSDPSVFTKNIQTVSGDVSINVSTNEEVSLENLLKVGGNYSVTGADVIDDNLLYAKSISLDYEDNYEIKTVYTDEIKLNVGKWKIKQNKSFSTSKNFLGNISMTAYHTDLFNLNLEDVITGDVSGTTYIDSLRETLPVMPDDNPVYTEFRQISDEPSTSGSIISDNISSITIGGHINVNKITSESCTEININNTELPSIEVVSTSVVTFEMPNLIELVSIILNLPKVDKLEFPLLVSITNISVTGVNEFSSPLLETIKGNFTLSGVSTAGLPKLETLGGTSSLPSNVNLTTGSGAPTLDRTGTAVPTGGASTGSGTSSSVGLGNTGDSSTGDGDDTEHNSGGSGDTPHNSGGSGDTPHNSGGSGDTAHDSGGSSGSGTSGSEGSVYYSNGEIVQTIEPIVFYDRELVINGIKLIVAGDIGGQLAVPDFWIYKTARVFELLIDKDGEDIDANSQLNMIKTLKGEIGWHQGKQAGQRIARGGGNEYSPNFLDDNRNQSYPGLEAFENELALDDMVWYKNIDSQGTGDDDINEILEHTLHTLHRFGVRGGVQGSTEALNIEAEEEDVSNTEIFLAMKEAHNNGVFDIEGYGGNINNQDAWPVMLKEYQYLLTYGMWGFSEFWEGGSLSPEWNDNARTPEGVLANNPLGYELYNAYFKPVISVPSKETLRAIFQDNDQGDSGYVPD